MSDPLIGKRIGQYDVLSLLGQGGMAVVYRVHQSTMKRDVAMKVLTTMMAQDPMFKERFEREVELVARLEHAHIVPVHEHGTTEDGIVYLTMRYIKGGTLNERIRSGKSMTLVEVNNVLQQVAGALDYAHQHGVIHRDIKPSNVMLDEQNNVYLTDFGLARMSQNDVQKNLTEADTFIGTPAYVSPEQINQGTIDRRSDLYSLAIVVYEMLAGRPPFTGDSAFSIMRSHLEEEPPALAQFRPDIPVNVQAVIRKALNKSPDMRFQTALEFADAFHRAVQGDMTTDSLSIPRQMVAQATKPDAPQGIHIPARVLYSVIAGIVVLAVLLLASRQLTAPDVPTAIPTMNEAIRADSGTPDDLKVSDSEKAAAKTVLGTDGFIGFTACSLKTDYHASIARAIRIRAEQLGLPVQIADAAEDATQQPIQINRFIAQGAKAVITCEIDVDSVTPALIDAQKAGVKIVRLADAVLGTGATSITLTNEAMGKAVGNYTAEMILKELGGKANVAILDYPNVPITVIRANEMEKALKGKVPDVNIVGRYTGGLPDEGEKSMTVGIKDHPEINVIMSINDAGAYGAIKALLAAGKKPDEVKIVSVDAENEARRMIKEGYFFVASVDSGGAATGTLAVDAVAKMLAGISIPKQISLPGDLVTKQSLLTPTP